MLHTHRVYQAYLWPTIEDEALRDQMVEGSRYQVGRYIVSSSMTMDEAEFMGAPLAVLAVVDDFGDLKRVTQ